MNKFLGGIVIASCAVFAASAALACEPMSGGRFGAKMFAGMDDNKDGAISKQEFDDFHNKHFAELDANNDGKITLEEFDACHSEKQEHRGDAFISKHFAAADGNHDGAISREEAKDMPMLLQHFDEADANKDGKVSEQELQEMMQGRHGTKPAKDDKAAEKK